MAICHRFFYVDLNGFKNKGVSIGHMYIYVCVCLCIKGVYIFTWICIAVDMYNIYTYTYIHDIIARTNALKQFNWILTNKLCWSVDLDNCNIFAFPM